MGKIQDINVLSGLLGDLNVGGLSSYDDEGQALILEFESGGGPQEDNTFFLKFNFVEFFQLPLSLDSVRVKGRGIDGLKVESQDGAVKLLPDCCGVIDYKKSKYRCYRFYANEQPTPFYIYCLNIEGWLDSA